MTTDLECTWRCSLDQPESIASFGEGAYGETRAPHLICIRRRRLGGRGSGTSAAAELRTTLRLKPRDAIAHYSLGLVRERKGDGQGALEQFRAAYDLQPDNPDFRSRYERLGREVKR